MGYGHNSCETLIEESLETASAAYVLEAGDRYHAPRLKVFLFHTYRSSTLSIALVPKSMTYLHVHPNCLS